jgi:N6-L-threonylcarbamoyladenine synthase
MTTILGIESSCDETSAAVSHEGKIISHVIATQDVHKTYGGVVPELASRAHQQHIVPVIDQALKQASITLNEISAVAYTQGPGLLGALLVGSAFARSIASAKNIPVIPVHHMRAHVLAHFIEDPKPAFPFLCLTVSGGHTQIVKVSDFNQMEVIGQTLDDAVGEAFDKAAKMLGLPYPGGPLIDKHAQYGDPSRFSFPPAEIPGLDYSFSGVKTAILYFLREKTAKDPDFIQKNLNDLCAGIQQSLVQMLLQKLKKAAKQSRISEIAIAGGVSANRGLRDALQTMSEEQGWKIYIPAFEYCTDNAAMIAISGHYLYGLKSFGSLTDSPLPRMPF